MTNYRARGLSLIEVVVGMAILGTFLTFIFIAQARLTKQSVIVRKKAQVIAAVDQLLTTWALDWASLPINDTGTLPTGSSPGSSDSETSGGGASGGGGEFQWTTRVIDMPQLTKLGLQKVELTVIDTSIINSTEPLLQMELAVPLPPPPETLEAAPKATSSTSGTSGTNSKQAQGGTP